MRLRTQSLALIREKTPIVARTTVVRSSESSEVLVILTDPRTALVTSRAKTESSIESVLIQVGLWAIAHSRSRQFLAAGEVVN